MTQYNAAPLGLPKQSTPPGHTLVLTEGMLSQMQLACRLADTYGEAFRPYPLGNGAMAVHNDVLPKLQF